MTPYCIMGLLSYIQDPELPLTNGLLFATIMTIANLTQTLTSEHFDFNNTLLSKQSQAAITSMLYKKLLRTSTATNKKTSQGQLVSLFNIDVGKFNWFLCQMSDFLMLPVLVLGCSIYLFSILKFSFIISLGIIMIPFFLNIRIGKLMS